MDSLADYILWMGDFPFSAVPFREADALVLCLLSYFDLSPVFADAADGVRVRDCQKMIDADNVRILITGKDMGYTRVLQLAAASRRFGALRMRDYVDLVREDPPLQFSAVCFHDETELSFLAFRGTDNTLAGWEEDFMISFTRTEAQELARQYAEAHLVPGRRWFMGGHSKGGNHALYAACMLEEETLARVERLFVLDGPGLCPEVMDLRCMQRIDSRATRIIPRFSVVGKLFEPKLSDTRIIQSSAPGFLQHSLNTWGIDHGGLALAESNDPRSVWINTTMDEWVADLSQEERIALVRDLFEALGAGGAETLDDIEAAGIGGFEQILRGLRASSESTRKSISELPRQAVTAASRLTGIRLPRLGGDEEKGPEG